MKFEFGVMSSKYELECDDLDSAKVAMVLFYNSNAPIAIYSPKEYACAFMPTEFLSRPEIGIPEQIRKAYSSIKLEEIKNDPHN